MAVHWPTVEDQRVDLLYRDLDVVHHWLEEAEAGRYEVDQVDGYLAGMAAYVLAGELALAELLAGEWALNESNRPTGRARHACRDDHRRSR
jgi:hypothetical protein